MLVGIMDGYVSMCMLLYDVMEVDKGFPMHHSTLTEMNKMRYRVIPPSIYYFLLVSLNLRPTYNTKDNHQHHH